MLFLWLLNFAGLFAVLAVVGIVVLVSRRGRSSEPSPSAMKPKTKLIAGILLGMLALGIGAVIVSLAMLPERSTYRTGLAIDCPGGSIYIGDELAGVDRVEIDLRGDEPFLLRPAGGSLTPDNIMAAILDAMPTDAQLPPSTSTSSFQWLDEQHELNALEPRRVIRPDQSVDWIIPIFGTIEGRSFCFPVRVRQGRAVEPLSGGMSSGTSVTHGGIFGKQRLQGKNLDISYSLKKRKADAPAAWLDRFPDGAPSLRE